MTGYLVPLDSIIAALDGDTALAMRLADASGLPAKQQDLLRDALDQKLDERYQEGYDAGYTDGDYGGYLRGRRHAEEAEEAQENREVHDASSPDSR